MMKLIFVFFVMIMCAVSCYANTYTGVVVINGRVVGESDCVKGNGKITKTTRALDGFEAISVSGTFSVSVIKGKGSEAVLEMDSNLAPLVETLVSDKTLIINAAESICTENPLRITVSGPVLKKISIDGASELVISYPSGYEQLSFSVAGSSEVTINGPGQKLTGEISDAGSLDASESVVKNVIITASGSSEAVVTVQENLQAKSSDASSIYYKSSGTAVISADAEDASDILPLSER